MSVNKSNVLKKEEMDFEFFHDDKKTVSYILANISVYSLNLIVVYLQYKHVVLI